MHGRGTSIRLISCAALALLLAAATQPSPAQATAATWKVRVDTTLTGDFVGTIEIVQDSVTLDCAGYKVTGDGHGRGIVVDKRTGVTVRNCDVSNFATGIWVSGTTNSAFEGNKSHDNLNGEGNGFVNGYDLWGFSPRRATSSATTRCSTTTTTDLARRTRPRTASPGNASSNNAAGFWVTGDSDGNSAVGNRAWGFSLFESSDNILSNNNAIDSGWAGFSIAGGDAHRAVGNRLEDNTATGSGGAGFVLVATSDNLLVDNQSEGNSAGFIIDGSSGNTLTDNTSTGNKGAGLTAVDAGSDDNVFTSNTASGNGYAGFAISGGAADNRVTHNTATENDLSGFLVNESATDNRLEQNVANHNEFGGFVVAAGSSGNILVGNDGSRNIYGFIATTGATTNTFQENTALGNSEVDGAQGSTSGENFWIDNCFGTVYGIPAQTACS